MQKMIRNRKECNLWRESNQLIANELQSTNQPKDHSSNQLIANELQSINQPKDHSFDQDF